MKILYFSSNRQDRELAAFALRSVGPDAVVTCQWSLAGTRRWIDENRNVAALILDLDSDQQGCESFVRDVRKLGITAPIIVASTKFPDSLTSLLTAVDEIVSKTDSLLNDLPAIVSRAHKAWTARGVELPSGPGRANGASKSSASGARGKSGESPFVEAIQASDAEHRAKHPIPPKVPVRPSSKSEAGTAGKPDAANATKADPANAGKAADA